LWRSDQLGIAVEAGLCLGCLGFGWLGPGCLGFGCLGSSWLGSGCLGFGCLGFGWKSLGCLPWRMKYHCGLQAWVLNTAIKGTG